MGNPYFSHHEDARIREVYARREAGVDKLRYSYFDLGNLFIIQERERQVLNLLKKAGYNSLGQLRILDVGCGSGAWLREFIKWGARPENLVGVDLIPERITQAKTLCPRSVEFYCEGATALRFPSGSFDVVLQSTVFSSIVDRECKQNVAREMRRVLKPQGVILWYDFFFDNPQNPDVRGVGKREILSLFPGCDVVLRRSILAPPLLRALAPHSWLLCYLLTRLRALNTFYLALIRRKD